MSDAILLHSIGGLRHSNYNTREQVVASSGLLTFDGIYHNVYLNRDILDGRSGILFVMGDYIGKDNTFDLAHVPKLEKYCDWHEIGDITNENPDFEVGWHTWSHPDLTTLSREDVTREVTPPFPMRTFAYPYGRYNDMVVDCVREAGYEKAYSVIKTDKTRWTIPRRYL